MPHLLLAFIHSKPLHQSTFPLLTIPQSSFFPAEWWTSVDLWHYLIGLWGRYFVEVCTSRSLRLFVRHLFLSVPVPEAWLRLPCAHQTGWGEMIWLMRIASLSIHGYFLESIRPIWLIQVVALIKGLPLSLHFHFSIALAFHFHWIRSLSSLLPSVRLSCTHFTTACFSWLEETDHTHLVPPSSVSYARDGWAMVIHYRFGK